MAWSEIRSIARAEGDDAMRMLDFIDITADLHGTRLVVTVEFDKQPIWRGNMAVSQHEIDYNMTDEKLQTTLSVHMRKQLNLVSQMHHARLDKLFPNAIKEVKLGFDTNKLEKLIIVVFKNGHVAEASEAESKTDLFTARCAMLYDLPPR